MTLDIDYEITDEEILAEEEPPDTTAQSDLERYLIDVLEWLYRAENWFIGANLAIVYDKRKYLPPDVSVCKGVVLTPAQRVAQKSYRIRLPDRPPPPVVFEVGSKETWQHDLGYKVERYGEMGAKEYFAYDPNTPRVWRKKPSRLLGWRYFGGLPYELQPDARGWLWSDELDSWLVPDNEYLRLYDRHGQRRLKETEALKMAEQQAWSAKEAADAAKEAAWAKLRELGYDPEKL
jgi:Uma2 family endonuclease